MTEKWLARVENQSIRDARKVAKDGTKSRYRLWTCDIAIYRGVPGQDTRIITIRGCRQWKGHLVPPSIRSGKTYWLAAVLSLPLYKSVISSLPETEVFQAALQEGVIDPFNPVEDHPHYLDMATGIVQKHGPKRPERKVGPPSEEGD